MNTIKIKLATSGRIAALDKNFPLYCGQFQNVLLNILVPTAILAGNYKVGQYLNDLDPEDPFDTSELYSALSAFDRSFTGDDSRPHEGDLVYYIYNNFGTYTYYTAKYVGDNTWELTQVDSFGYGQNGTSVKVGMIGTLRNGAIFKTENYYMRYVKTITANDGIEYAMYERTMPKEFAGSIGKQAMVINVVNGDNSSIESIITSQTAELEILPSTNLDKDSPISPSEYEELSSSVNELRLELSTKQDKQDNGIRFTTEKTVVGALNDLNDRELSDREDIDEVTSKANSNEEEIAKIKDGRTIVKEAESATYDSNGDNIASKFAGIESGTIKVGAARIADTASAVENDGAGNNIAQQFSDIVDGTTKVGSAFHADEADAATNDSAGANIADQFASIVADIADLQALIYSGEHFVGTMTLDHAPTNADLTGFVETTEGREPQRGDSVIVTQVISGGTDKTYKYIFNGTTWEGYEIPPVERAANGTAGLVTGTYGVGSTNNTLVDIVNGEILNIWIKDGNSYRNIVEFIGANKAAIANIIDGTTVVGEAAKATNDGTGASIATQFANIINGTTKVGAASSADSAEQATKDGSGNNIAQQFGGIISGTTKVGAASVADSAEVATKDSAGGNIATQFSNIVSGTTQVGSAAYAEQALKAVQDALGNNIVNTYLTQAAGATKAFVKDYALPKEFNDVLYISSAGLVETAPTTPASGIQFTATSTAIGETPIFSASYTLGDKKIQLSSKNSYTARVFVEANGTAASVQFKATIRATKSGQNPVLLCVDLLPEQALPTSLTALDFGAAFSSLGNTILNLSENDTISISVSAIMADSATTEFNIYSNDTYPSRVNLNTATQTVIYRESEVGQAVYVLLTTSDLSVSGGNGYFTTANDDFIRLVDRVIDSQVILSIPDLSLVSGIDGNSSLYLNNIPLTSAKNSPAKLEDFDALKRSDGTYMMNCVLRRGAMELSVDAPRIANIRRLA